MQPANLCAACGLDLCSRHRDGTDPALVNVTQFPRPILTRRTRRNSSTTKHSKSARKVRGTTATVSKLFTYYIFNKQDGDAQLELMHYAGL